MVNYEFLIDMINENGNPSHIRGMKSGNNLTTPLGTMYGTPVAAN